MTERRFTADDPRLAEIEANLAAVRDRIEQACAAAARDPATVTLVAITKTFPVDDVGRLAALGVTDVGENRDQEARDKAAALPELRWHFVGQLQRNKARSVAGWAQVVHSVDRGPLVTTLGAEAVRAGRTLTALVQVDLDDPRHTDASARDASARGGAAPGDVPALADQIAAAEGLRLGGLMAVAPPAADPDVAFARLAEVAAALRAAHAEATIVSAGMSGDLEAALRHGATHLRIGTALLGRRTPPLR